jgi:hypothetical protein
MKRLTILMIATALLVALMPSTGFAQTDDEDEGLLTLHPELSAGPWFGSGSAGGTTTADVGGMHMEFTADYDANFFFDVTTEGATTGEWDIQGPVQLDANGDSGSFHMVGDLAGTGPVSGDAVTLSVDGSTTTNGTVTISAGGQTFTREVANSAGNPTIDIEVTTTFCNEAYGDWIVSVNQRLEDFSWDPTFSGSWVATRQVDAFAQLGFLEKTEVLDGLNELFIDFFLGTGPASDASGRRFVGTVTTTDWSEISADLVRAEELINKLRNLSVCDRELIGEDNIEFWLQILTEGINALIEQALANGFLTGTNIRLLATIGLRTGAIGAGSLFGNGADLLRQLADIAASRVDDWYWVNNGTPPETVDLFVLGAQLGWSYTVGDQTLPASQLLAMLPDVSSLYEEGS